MLNYLVVNGFWFFRKDETSKQARKLPFTSQLYATKTPKNVMLTKSNYLIPKFHEYDFGTFEAQDHLEKSWAGLSNFRQSHKGRLDSAKTNTKPNKLINIGE